MAKTACLPLWWRTEDPSKIFVLERKTASPGFVQATLNLRNVSQQIVCMTLTTSNDNT